MPAAVESMFSVRQTPWHGLGAVIQDAPTIAEGIKLAGLDWYVELRNTATLDGLPMQTRAVVRKTDNKIVGEVGPKYVPLQNLEAFDFFQPFIDAGEAELTTAGSLFDGSRIWVLCKIKRDNVEIRKNDEIAKFVMLSNGHDGKLAVRVGFTPIRIVCANTLAMAHHDKASKLIRIRHKGDVVKSLVNVRETMDAINAEFNATAEKYSWLATRSNINKRDLERYVKIILKVEGKKTEELSTRMKNTIDEIVKMAEAGLGNTGATWWDAYNGVTEYLNYSKGNNASNRMNNLWLGTDFATNLEALDAALTLAA